MFVKTFTKQSCGWHIPYAWIFNVNVHSYLRVAKEGEEEKREKDREKVCVCVCVRGKKWINSKQGA